MPKTVLPLLPLARRGAGLWARVGFGLSVLVPGLPALAADGAQLASDHGCLNCHYAQAKAAPSLQHLAERMGRSGVSTEAVQSDLREMREKGSIHSHQTVSDDSALAVLRWMAQGAK